MLSELCVRRPVFATMLVMSLVVLGIFSFRDLGVDLFPQGRSGDGERPLRLPGASPDEMTSAVVMPMENALSGIAGIDQMSATRQRGRPATITVRFLLERDLDDAANNVREKVAGAMRNVPPEVLPPIIQKQDPDADPIMSIVLSSKATSLRTLTEIADKQVKRGLESVDGVGEVSISGDRPREIHIVVDIEKLNARGLSIDQVRDAISEGERRDPWRHARTGQMGSRAAHDGPHRRDPPVQQHHRVDDQRHAGPHLRHRLRRGLERRVTDLALPGRRQSGRPTRHPAGVGREHHQGHRGGQAEAEHAFARRCRAAVTLRSIPTTRGSSTPPSSRSRSTCCGAACWRRWS